jgi:alpha(1,3/1,4) fucosyltransferase
MNKPIRIWFSDFWFRYEQNETFFTPILKKHFNVELNPSPDVLIHSVLDKNFLKYNCTRVCYTAENTRPDFTLSDYHIGFDYCDNPRYLRFPNFLTYYKPELLTGLRDPDEIVKQKTKFCAFVVSNEHAKERIDFFHALSKYKKVDSGGRALNNIGQSVKDKMEFIKSYKFVIAFENSAYPGYTTEKIYEPFLVNSVPLYWGNQLIDRDFNSKAFIDAGKFPSYKELIDYIEFVDRDEKTYLDFISQSCFPDNKVPELFKEERIVEFFDTIFSGLKKTKPVASRTDYLSFISYKTRYSLFRLRKKIGLA